MTYPNTTYPLIEPGFIIAIKVTAGTTCILSILGSCLIIFSYVVLVDLRTAARQLLVNLSIADIIICLSHFVGLFTNFERFIEYYNPEAWNTSTTDPVCISQAAFTQFGSISSFLWSMAIGLYLVMLTLCMRKRPTLLKKIMLPILYIVCWGLPVIFIIPNAVQGYFGFTLGADIGWCYIMQGYIGNMINHYYLAAEIIGYEIWVYIAFIALPILYIILFAYLKCKIRAKKKYQLLLSPQSTQASDIKLLFVPAVFLLLRIWTTIIDIIIFYASPDPQSLKMNLMTNGIAALVLLAGIGVNAQGFVNSILFCVFTTKVRQGLISKETYINFFKCGSATMDVTTGFNHEETTTLSYGTQVRTHP